MNEALEHIEAFATKLLTEGLDDKFTFHNLAHTQKVVAASKQLATKAGLSETEVERLIIAAWLHDTGYAKGRENHEETSVKFAQQELGACNYDEEGIEVICQAILETQMPHKPETELGKLLCDADLSGIGSSEYLNTASALRKEMADCFDVKLSEHEWLKKEVDFLSAHSYHTEAGKALYEEQKQQNINLLQNMIDQAQTDGREEVPEAQPIQKPKKKKKGKATKTPGYSRGVETMFRAGARTHINLSSMADSKANIMLSVNAMIVSVVLTVLVPKLDSNQHLIIPAIVLIATCLIAMILATVATRPVISSGHSSKEDIANKKSNLLFFGNFHNMDLEDYEEGMKQMMGDNDFLYGSLTRDMYYLGKVLNKKYRYLRICYTVFMVGMVASVLAFGIALYTTPEFQ